MSNYNHILLILDDTFNETACTKANALANCFGARLSIGYCIPNIPSISHGAINMEKEYREIIASQLCCVGKRHKIPLEDQWILSQTENKNRPLEQLRKKGIDLIVVGKNIQLFELRSQLANKLLHQYNCTIYFIH